MVERVGFNVAMEALKSGKCVSRLSGINKYVSRKIEMLGKTEIEYGKIDSSHKYNKGAIFDYEDIFANDWIIEDKR